MKGHVHRVLLILFLSGAPAWGAEPPGLLAAREEYQNTLTSAGVRYAAELRRLKTVLTEQHDVEGALAVDRELKQLLRPPATDSTGRQAVSETTKASTNTGAVRTDGATTGRTWVSSSGSSIKATLVGIEGQSVHLKEADGKRVSVSYRDLSPADQQYLSGINLDPIVLPLQFENRKQMDQYLSQVLIRDFAVMNATPTEWLKELEKAYEAVIVSKRSRVGLVWDREGDAPPALTLAAKQVSLLYLVGIIGKTTGLVAYRNVGNTPVLVFMRPEKLPRASRMYRISPRMANGTWDSPEAIAQWFAQYNTQPPPDSTLRYTAKNSILHVTSTEEWMDALPDFLANFKINAAITKTATP